MISVFGDEIDWNAEARRAEAVEPPGDSPSETIQCLMRVLDGVPSPRVVDCGCNIARFYPQCLKAGFDYVGVDQADEAVAIARKRYPEIRIYHGFLWDNWPGAYPPFDAAFTNAVLQHNIHPDKARILERIADAVRPGGYFAMVEAVAQTATQTQLTQLEWIQLVEAFGFKLIETWHPNDAGFDDSFLFQRSG